jgi:hypothetical protein
MHYEERTGSAKSPINKGNVRKWCRFFEKRHYLRVLGGKNWECEESNKQRECEEMVSVLRKKTLFVCIRGKEVGVRTDQVGTFRVPAV